MREYIKRLPWKIAVKEYEIKHSDASTRQRKEADALLLACEGCERIIALDERGKDMGSRDFSKYFVNWQQEGISSIALIIGGADGLLEEVRKKANLTIAFGRATWPHMLVRAMLSEQLYRVSTILENHPYHRD